LKHRVLVRPQARDELAEAARWYRGKSPLVATAFRAAVRQTVQRISERPASFPEISPGIRRALARRFPYAIFFAVEQTVVVVLAIKQQAQDPASWPTGG
jgi:plasmid stabilization system protein ParE